MRSRVLPHASTRYRSYRDAIVSKVNGKVPNDFREFAALLDKGEGDRILIEFEGVNVAPLVLSRNKLKLAHEEINKRYGILEDRHVQESK